MIAKRRLFINAFMAALQVAVHGFIFFFLYRFLLDEIGDENFGVWALVMATTSVSAIANLGLATTTIKFVSQYLAREDREQVSRLVQTAVLSVAAFLGLVIPLAYPLFKYAIGVFIEPATKLPEALLILPYAMASFWLNAVAGVYQSSLDGFQRIDIRGVLVMITTVVYFVICLIIVPQQGLEGLAKAQVVQGMVILLLSLGALKRLLPELPLLPYQWHKSAFREMLGYTLNFQLISIFRMLIEPTAKSLISKFGGVSVLAYFEMANRMVVLLRNFIATAHRAIVPAIADLQERAPEKIRALYGQSFHLLSFLMASLLPLCLLVTPSISRLWLGEHNEVFIFFGMILFGGWFVNLLSNPAYFANMGTGHLFWNVTSEGVKSVLNLGLGLALGLTWGAYGPAVAFMIAHVLGSLLIAMMYQRKHRLPWRSLLRSADFILFACGMLLLWGGLSARSFFEPWPAWLAILVLVIGYVLFLAPVAWIHPMRRQLMSWTKSLIRT